MNKSELKYIFFSAIFAIVWFMFAMPKLVKLFDGDSPYIHFLIFNLGLYAFLFIFLKSLTISAKFDFLGATGIIALFLALDIFMPDYHVGFSGELIKGAMLGTSSSDYVIGFFGASLGLKGVLLFGFTYLVVPFILLIIVAQILPNFVKSL